MTLVDLVEERLRDEKENLGRELVLGNEEGDNRRIECGGVS